MFKSDSIKEIAAALNRVQASLQCAKKDATNPHFKKNYADLAEVVNVSKALLSEHGLAVIQGGDVREGITGLSTLLTHISGEWIESFYPLNPAKNDPQGFGSAVTYARRYMRSAMLGIVSEEDDDGNAASNGKAKAEPKKEGGAKQEVVANDIQTNISNCKTSAEIAALWKKEKPRMENLTNGVLERVKEHFGTRKKYLDELEKKTEASNV